MSFLICKPTPNNSQPKNAVAAFFNKFNTSGLTQDFADKRGKKSKTVIIQFFATGQNVFRANKPFFFAQDIILSNSKIDAIEVLSTVNIRVPITNPQTDFADNNLKKGLLYLVDHCGDNIATLPLSSLCRSQNGNKLTFTNFENINWGASYVKYIDGTTALTAANSLAFQVYYK